MYLASWRLVMVKFRISPGAKMRAISGLASDRCRGGDLVFQSVQRRTQNGGDRQIGVHVATCLTVFEPSRNR